MNINKFTIKSQEAIQLSQNWQKLRPATNRKRTYFFKAIFEIDENVAPFLKKLNVNVPFSSNIGQPFREFPKFQAKYALELQIQPLMK
jgi:ATP-dependent Clp protease ATP-binding subunit ClpB